ncbi:MAG: CBS domain-containing protein [Gemmatimonadota bacterium]|nr:CBS domain-containing protein [Gemmatimonadota bacterium]HEU4989884.1 CBS domain-containing protein [Gemmatimonadaceae bacterium]
MTGAATVIVWAALLVAWLVAGVTAVRLASRMWLRQWAEHGLRGAPVPLESVTGPQRLIASGSVAIGFVLATAGALLAARMSVRAPALVGELAIGAAVVVFVAQLTARALARHSTAALAAITLPVLRTAALFAAPALAVARRVGGRPASPGPATERRAVERLLREGELEGVSDRDDALIISGVAEFGDKVVGSVMTPRDQVFAISDATPAQEAAEHVARSAYSRVPVFHGTLDHVTGMIHAFDLLRGPEEALAAPRPVARAASTAPCSALLFQMLRDHQHLAIVHDQTHRTLGIVTLEDLLEELVGDIRDEHDEPAPPTA